MFKNMSVTSKASLTVTDLSLVVSYIVRNDLKEEKEKLNYRDLFL